MPRSSTKCDSCPNEATQWSICKRPSDKSEIVSTMACCDDHKLSDNPASTPDAVIESIKLGGGVITREMVDWLYESDEAIKRLSTVGVLFVSI